MLKKIFQRSLEISGTLARSYRDDLKRPKVAVPPESAPVMAQVDVLVVGGGISGITAALAAARAGAKTLLVERNSALGGLVTASLVTAVSHQYLTKDGLQVLRGLASELVERIAQAGGAPSGWLDWRIPKIPLDVEVFKLVVAEMLSESGVEVWLGTPFYQVVKHGQAISHVIVQTTSGLEAIAAKIVVDSTGNANVARASRAPTNLGASVDTPPSQVVRQLMRDKGWVRNSELAQSMQFAITGLDVDQFVDYIKSHPESVGTRMRGDLVEDSELTNYLWHKHGILYVSHWDNFDEQRKQAVDAGDLQLRIGGYDLIEGVGCSIDGLRSNGFYTVTANRVLMTPFDARQYSRAMLEGQKVCQALWLYFKKYLPGFANSVLQAVAPELGVRRSVQIVGANVFTAEDRLRFSKFDDEVGILCRKEDDCYQVPYRCMLPRKVSNLLVASGKTVSTDIHTPYRTKPACMVIGQAGGAAAALCAAQGIAPKQLDRKVLQRKLLEQGVYLGDEKRLNELGIAPGNR
jgi:FAD-dependent oxidoreductase family protein